MPDQPKLTPAQIVAQTLAKSGNQPTPEQAQESAKYAAMNGKKFSNGAKVIEIRQYVPSRLSNGKPSEQFLVNFGNPNVSFFRDCNLICDQFPNEVIESTKA